MKKYSLWLTSFLLVLLVLSGCGRRRGHRMYQDNEEDIELSSKDSEDQTETKEEDIGEDIEDEEKEETEDDEYDEWIGTGVYHEHVDSESIEVEMDEEVETYYLTDWAQENLEDFEEGDEISFYYYDDDEELVIDEIHDHKFDWEEEYGFDTRYNHHHRHRKNHHRDHHRNNRDHPRNRRHHHRRNRQND